MKQAQLPRSEFGEQQTLVQWLQLLENKGQIRKFTAIPNNTWTPSDKQKNKNKELGLRAGFPDLIILTNRNMLVIEMKIKPNKPTPLQEEWLKNLNAVGITARVCYSFEEARDLVQYWI